MIPVYQPYLTKESLKYAHDAIDSGWISSHGRYLDLAKEKLQEVTDSKYVILTNNGTSATHLVACSLAYRYPFIERLIVPSNVYVAAWNMFKSNPDYKLIPVDSAIETWNMNIVDEPEYDVAILVVHNLGNILNVPLLKRKYPKTIFVEDNCEGFGGTYEGHQSGTASLSYSISFFGNKNITSGEGGAFCTDDEAVYNEMFRVRAHGVTPEKFVFDGLGYNYRMTNVQAALLYGQLELLQEITDRKQEIFEQYRRELQHPVISFQKNDVDTLNANWMLGIRLCIAPEIMDKLVLHLHYNDIETRPMFPCINRHSHLDKGSFPTSEVLENQVLILPSYPELTSSEVSYICNTIKNFLK